MFQAENVQDTRPFFFETWEKYKQSQPLTPLENQLIDVILAHPEYHVVLDNPNRTADKTYFAELGMSNPFLHMGLHLAVRDQIKTNRPPGIQSVYNTLSSQLKAPLEAEHQLMQCLEDCLWRAQQHNTMPDESAYFQACLAKTTASNESTKFLST